MSVWLWVLMILGVLAACGLFLWFFPGAFDPPSLKRARARRRLMAYEAYEKNRGDVPIVIMNGVLMHMDCDGRWVEVDPHVDGQE